MCAPPCGEGEVCADMYEEGSKRDQRARARRGEGVRTFMVYSSGGVTVGVRREQAKEGGVCGGRVGHDHDGAARVSMEKSPAFHVTLLGEWGGGQPSFPGGRRKRERRGGRPGQAARLTYRRGSDVHEGD